MTSEELLKLTEQVLTFAKDIKNVERPNVYYQNCVFERPYPILLNPNQAKPEINGEKMVRLEIEELEKYIAEKSGADPKQISYFIGYVREFLEGHE